MRTKQINTGKTEILLVELPEGGGMATYGIGGLGYFHNGRIIVDSSIKGDWTMLSLSEKMTEKMAISILRSLPHHIWNHRVYKDYNGKYTFPSESYVFNTALESLNSLYEANEVYWENPLGDKPEFTSGDYDDNGFGDVDKRQYKTDLENWKEAQQKVWDKSRTYILIKQK